MVHEFKFPDVGEGITEGKLVSWKVKVGDEVKKDDPLCEVETDKAVVEIPAPEHGKIHELLAKEGDTLEVGNVFVTIDDGTGGTEPAPTEEKKEETPSAEAKTEEKSAEAPKEEAKTEEIKVPEEKIPDHIMENAQEIDVKDQVKEVVATPSVKKLARELDIDIKKVIGSGPGGKILEEDVRRFKDPHSEQAIPKEEDTKEVGVEEAKADKKVDDKSEKVAEEKPVTAPEVKKSSAPDASEDVLAMPRVRALAKEKGIDLATVKPSGKYGEILEADLGGGSAKTEVTPKEEAKTEEKPVAKGKEESKDEEKKEVGKGSSDGPVTLSGIRGVISSKMVESLSKAAQVTICDEANISDLVEFRTNEKERLAKKGIKLTYLPFFMKAVVAACSDYPKFNGVFNDDKNELEISSEFNIGIATDTEKGLVVPNINGCESKSIISLSKELTDNTAAAREGKLSPKAMAGGTFSITSIGSLGGQFFTPILNYPQVAILGIGKIVRKPIVKDEDDIGIADMVGLSLTFDHRVIDGAEAAKFLRRLVELIEDVEELLIE